MLQSSSKLEPATAKRKPPNAGKGRPKGSKNVHSAALKDMILQALHEQPGGGVAYLKIQAVENPGPFMTLLGRVLPTTLAGDKDNPITIVASALDERL